MENNYPKAYKEVIEILKHVPTESINKIPREMLDMFIEKMDNEYSFTVDTNKTFAEQNLLEETKAIMANIFRDYWATPYQRERIIAKENYDKQKAEEEKREKYNPNDIFKNRVKPVQENILKESSNLPIEVKKEKFYEKLVDFIKRLLHL